MPNHEWSKWTNEPREEDPLVGPPAEESKKAIKPHEVRLQDGSPLYHVFLEKPDAPVIDVNDVRQAKQRLSRLIETNPEVVLQCQGFSGDDARNLLEKLEK